MQDEELTKTLSHLPLYSPPSINTSEFLLNPYLVFDFHDYINNTCRVLIRHFLFKYNFTLLFLEYDSLSKSIFSFLKIYH